MKEFIQGILFFFISSITVYSQIADSVEKSYDYNHKGYELMMNGNYTEAILQFDSAIIFYHLDANYNHNRAYCYNAIDSVNLAISDYLIAIKLDPENYEYYYLLGNIYQTHKKIEVAILYYTSALSKIKSRDNPDTYILLFNRGNCYLKSENIESALADYNFSLKLNPEHIPTYANRGTTKIKRNDTLVVRS